MVENLKIDKMSLRLNTYENLNKITANSLATPDFEGRGNNIKSIQNINLDTRIMSPLGDRRNVTK